MVQMAQTAGGLTLALATVIAAPAPAQVTPGSQNGLGLTGADIPPILKQVQADPYRAPAAPACESIPQEILALNQVLGPDVDGERVKASKVHMALNYARGMIPYRGYVRFLTRADSKDKALQAAATAGYARRGFLRGLGAQLQCAPAADTAVANVSDKVADIQVTEIKVAEVEPAPKTAPGEEIARQMLTPVVSIPATPAAPGEARPVSTHVVYQWVDTVSGRPIVPDDGR
ncbi:hypothetical protein [Phenylobacterium sp.]|jgi:hypothetical protein|uniref:hypothetical protein n=1 Tax=Phenylobacterium sp. TaxID=1871053 RepID=UPI002E30FE61|nr:hypothetical protein [Phenylobacterium sp.]HEX3364707.1 hypothetical protein [Phenylobacterium sp.]